MTVYTIKPQQSLLVQYLNFTMTSFSGADLSGKFFGFVGLCIQNKYDNLNSLAKLETTVGSYLFKQLGL